MVKVLVGRVETGLWWVKIKWDKELEMVDTDYSLDPEMKKNQKDKLLTRGKLKLERKGLLR